MVAFNGSVIENYPGYLANCQSYINDLATANGADHGLLDLVAAKESSILGAAVALACVGGGEKN
jgi:hexokinase